jgi:NAD(P)-dependent dehydrogenase (short-subunit alcohol dehydrogenase family)
VVGVDISPGFDGFAADVSDPEQMAAAVRAVGELDVCVANAGVSLMEPFLVGDLASWRRVIEVNLLGVMVTLQAAARAMPGGGRLLATASIAGLHGEASAAAYCASKAGVIALVRTLSIELGPAITVNAVAPGQIETSMSLGDLEEVSRRTGCPAAELLEGHLERRVPARRMGTADEVAAALTFLAGPDAAFVSGEILRIDGGELAG